MVAIQSHFVRDYFPLRQWRPGQGILLGWLHLFLDWGAGFAVKHIPIFLDESFAIKD